MHNSVAIDAIEKKLTQNRLTGLLEAFVICYSLGNRLNKLKKQASSDDALITADGAVPKELCFQIFKVQELSHQIADALKSLFRHNLQEFSKHPHNSKKITGGKNYDLAIKRYCNMICVIDRAIHQFDEQKASEDNYKLLRVYQDAFAKDLFEVLGEKNLTVHWEATDYLSDGDYETCKSVCQDYIDGSAKVDAVFVGKLSERYSKDLVKAQAVSFFNDLSSEADTMDELLDFQESIEISLFKIRNSISETGFCEDSKIALLDLLVEVDTTSYEMFEWHDDGKKDFLSRQQVRAALVRNISEVFKNNERDSFEQAVADMGEKLGQGKDLDQLGQLCDDSASHYSQLVEHCFPVGTAFRELRDFYGYYVAKFSALAREAKFAGWVKSVVIKARAAIDSYQSQLNLIVQDPDVAAQVKHYTDAYKNVMASKFELDTQLTSVGVLESKRFKSTLDAYDKLTIEFVFKIKKLCIIIAKYIESEFNSDLGQRDLQESRSYIRSLLMSLQDNISLLEECAEEVEAELSDFYDKTCHAAIEIYTEIKRIVEVKTQVEAQIEKAMELYNEDDYVASNDCCSTILFGLKEHMGAVSDESSWFKEVLEKLQLDVVFFHDDVKEELVAASYEEEIEMAPFSGGKVSSDGLSSPQADSVSDLSDSSDSWEQVDPSFRPAFSDAEPVMSGRKDINQPRHPLGDLPSNTWVSRSSELSYSPDGVENSCDSLRGSGGDLNLSCMYARPVGCSRYAGMVLDESIEDGWVAVGPVTA
jgi:hypothetical protein